MEKIIKELLYKSKVLFFNQGKIYEKFVNACKLVHELLANIYEGFYLFIRI